MLQVESRAPTLPLQQLAGGIARACAMPVEQIPQAMADAFRGSALQPGLLLPEHTRGGAARYARHVLYADPAGRFSIVAIVWQPGQFSAVHGHYTWCGYAVVAGTLFEENYVWEPREEAVRRVGSRERRRGDTSFEFAGLDQTHRLGNAGVSDAISIHVYGIDGARVGSHVNRYVESRAASPAAIMA